MKYTGTSTRAKPRGRVAMYIAENMRISHAICVYITTTPYLPCNNKNINRKELYDFYYTVWICLCTPVSQRCVVMELFCQFVHWHCQQFNKWTLILFWKCLLSVRGEIFHEEVDTYHLGEKGLFNTGIKLANVLLKCHAPVENPVVLNTVTSSHVL